MKVYRYRKHIQTIFLILFLVFLTLTVWPLGHVYLGAFLLADPLITLNSAVNGVFKWEMGLALVVAVATIMLGRVFCGYVCPLGFFIELLAPRRQEIRKTKTRELLIKAPVFILTACVGLLLFGGAIYLVLDPLSLMTRSVTVIVYPVVDRTIRLIGDIFYIIPIARSPVDFATNVLSGKFIFQRMLAYHLQFAIFVMIAVLVGLSIYHRRLWCRHLCPLGALLGFMSRFSIFGRVVDESKCTNCQKCEAVCPMDAIRDDGLSTDTSRCQLSFECGDICEQNAVSFGIGPRRSLYNPGRRAFLSTAGLAITSGFLINTGLAREIKDVRLIRPPGALEESDFLSVCCRCGQCMKVCPTNVLQPSLTSGGFEGIFSPQMDFDHSYCDWTCNECSKVCPTGAIGSLTLEAKQKTVIGRAYIDENRCLPWADYEDCLVCEELCPVPDKAVIFNTERVKSPGNGMVTLKRPKVIKDKCIGCGICEHYCPVAHRSAINVNAIGQGDG